MRISRDLSQSPHAGLPRAADRASQMQLFFPPRRGGASHEQMCDFGIMGMWYSRVPQNHHDLHPLLGWKDMHIHPSMCIYIIIYIYIHIYTYI